MGQDTRLRMVVIVVLTLIFAYIVVPIPDKPTIPLLKEAKLHLGIDLAGGAELTYRVLYESKAGVDSKALTTAATDVIRNRIQQSGLKEPIITSRGDDRIVIQLAGVDKAGLADYKKLIAQAGKLQLFAAASAELQERYKKDGQVPQGYKVWTHDQPFRDGEYAVFRERMLLQEKPIIEGKHIATAGHRQQLDPLRGMGWIVTFELKTDGAKLFDEAAEVLFKQKPHGLIAIVLDDKVISAPAVQTDHFGGSGIITGNFDEKEANRLGIILRSGSLPAPIGSWDAEGRPRPGAVEAENFVGPMLGQDAIRRGLFSSGLSLLLVSVFMLVYYRSAGLIAVATLALNMVYLLGIMSLFGATLTLPGIAGIVLTVGMAVDANILIYERIREEQSRGKSVQMAFEAGHERALRAIIDSNVTTLIVAVVLYYVGIGPVRGFAVTLSIGILTTLFSVIFCGKTFLRMRIIGGISQFRMMRLFSDPKLDYIKYARPLVVASAVLVTAGTVFFATRGQENFGPDFRGGAMLVFGFNEPQDIDFVRSKVQGIRGPDGLPRYPDATIQTVADPGAKRGMSMLGSKRSRTFQLRTPLSVKAGESDQNVRGLRESIQSAFAGLLSHEPFEEMPESDVDPNPRLVNGGPGGRGFYFYLRDSEGFSIEEVNKKAAEALKDVLAEGAFDLREAPGSPMGLRRLKLTLAKRDVESEGDRKRRLVREAIQAKFAGELSVDPFAAEDIIGPTVARELKNSSIWAMIISWILMICYIGFRFASWRYGVAAVLALVHDALVAIAFTSVAGAVIPKSWGLSFDMNQTTLAAILTIIGYSINDTIVIFDRIRENLILMKKASFAEVINASVNQTMSRTILTALTVWISCVVLYLFTMHTGGGIAEFAFPMIIGVIAGTYSTIYIASPVVLWWYGGRRPVAA